MRPWWERWPGRLEHELAELDRAEIPYDHDTAAFKEGIVQLVVHPEVDGEQHRLVAVFPDFYPDVRFEVYAQDLTLAHHQNPFSKNLCLIGRASENWRPSDTLAAFLRDQLPKVLRTGSSDDAGAARGIEEPQAEPFTDYYPYVQPEIILVDSSWSLDSSIPGGELRIGLEDNSIPIRGAVLEVRGPDGTVLACADDAVAKLYRQHKPLVARWVRALAPISHAEGKDFLKAIASIDNRLFTSQWRRVDNGQVDIVGVVFPEETQWRQTGDGWVFLLRVQRPQIQRGKMIYAFVRAGYAGREDLTARVPELTPLAENRVAVFGLGALGMPSALALAQSGVAEIRAVDSDIVDPGIAPRWPFGLSTVGLPKVTVLDQFVTAQYPYTTVTPYQHRLGSSRRYGQPNGGRADREVLGEILSGVHLVYDATAEAGLHPLLDRLCRERGIPYICVSATNGAWGGTVVRTRLETGCWHCFLAAQDDGTIPTPRAAPSAWVQPVGCASPTFTGAGFELEMIAQSGVRMAVATLTGGVVGGYPDAEWDVGIADLRSDAGQPIPPRWQAFPLVPHFGCQICSTR